VARRRRMVRCGLALTGAAVLVGGLWLNRSWLAPAATAAGLAAVAAWRVRPDSDPDRWARGAAGEAATADLLTHLPRRFVVLHDRQIPGARANVDHLVIGPTGVWLVDSKSYRARLRVRRGAAWAGKYRVPTESAAWEAERVGRLLGMPVRAIVAVHGEGLRRRGIVTDGVPVIPARRLCRHLRRGRRVLTGGAVLALAKQAEARL
jgi:hypothetical protein